MTAVETDAVPVSRGNQLRSRLLTIVMLLAAALMLCWPAFYNGYPILYPDSMTYVADGPPVARAVFLHHYAAYYGMRSLVFSLGILPLHWNKNIWPVAFAQALLTAWVIWLLIRTLLPARPRLYFMIVMAILSALTTVSWYASLIMPDIFGPLMYLAIYLLVFARISLSRPERIALLALIAWSVAAHATHLMLVVALCVPLGFAVLLLRTNRPQRVHSLAEIVAAIVLSMAVTISLNAFLYGKPSLNGDRPPFLTARIIADGTGRMYLQQNCSHLNWVICKHVANLPSNADDFLWAPGGVWDSSDPGDQDLLLAQEMPLVLATVRAYPRQQLLQSSRSVWNQLNTFGIDDFDTSSWVLEQFQSTLPSQRSQYLNSRQQRTALPLEAITTLQDWVVYPSLVLFVLLTPVLYYCRLHRLAWLSAIVFFITVANAAVSGILSMVDDRYQARVVWLIPLLVLIILIEAITRWMTLYRRRQGPWHRRLIPVRTAP